MSTAKLNVLRHALKRLELAPDSVKRTPAGIIQDLVTAGWYCPDTGITSSGQTMLDDCVFML